MSLNDEMKNTKVACGLVCGRVVSILGYQIGVSLCALLLAIVFTGLPSHAAAQSAGISRQAPPDPFNELDYPSAQPPQRLPYSGNQLPDDPANQPLMPLNLQQVQQHPQLETEPRQFVISPFGKPSDIQIDVVDGRISLVAKGAPLRDVVTLLAEKHGMNLVMAQDGAVPISITLNQVSLMDALEAVVSVAGYTWTTHRGIVHVSSISSSNTLTPHVQGRITRVFELDYVSAVDLDVAIREMLSPSGSSQVMLNDPLDNRRTKEVVVVEDFPAFVHRIEQYVAAIDILPRQVLIQVHVLEVDLDDQNRHGVNFESLMRLGGGNITINTVGLANAVAGQAMFAEINGTDVDALLEALATHTDSETLASPRVLAMNGQESRLQVGERLGFRTNTTTETSTLESINFLEVGVVLNVTPRITREENVLLHIRPEVSSGAVNENTGLPNETTSEVETNLVLKNGQGVVIGGLIQERESFTESKAPFLGDIKLLGGIFRRRVFTTDRSEVIFVLVPHIIPLGCGPEPWQGNGELINNSNKAHRIDFQQQIRCDYAQPAQPVYGPATQTIHVPTTGQQQHVAPVNHQQIQQQHQQPAPASVWQKLGIKRSNKSKQVQNQIMQTSFDDSENSPDTIARSIRDADLKRRQNKEKTVVNVSMSDKGFVEYETHHQLPTGDRRE